MQFVVAIERGNEDQAYGVVVPDLPGCYSAGDTFEEALTNVREAIVMHLEALGAKGIEVIVPQGGEAHVGKPEFKDWLWGFVDVDDRLLSDRTERINITVPARKLLIIDKAATIAGKARSEYLVENALSRALESLHRPDRYGREHEQLVVPDHLEPRVVEVTIRNTPKRRQAHTEAHPLPAARKGAKTAKARRKHS